jgi:hypothetical protein
VDSTPKETAETMKETVETAQENYNQSNVVSLTVRGVESVWKQFQDKSRVIHCATTRTSDSG